MTFQQPLPQEWTQALAAAQNEALYVREGLSALEFAALANVHPNTVGRYARRGLERFQAKFGPGCSFEKVKRPNSSQEQWRLTFAGAFKESPEVPPVPGALRALEFCQRNDVPSIWSLYGYHLNGHEWFRQRFPGWDFQDVPRGTKCVIRWYVPVKATELQMDVIPPDNLTVKQFGLLMRISVGNLVRICRQHGLKYFEAKFPGWTFQEESGKLSFFRFGMERSQFNLLNFARHIGRSASYVRKQINLGRFEVAFPGWQVQSFSTPGSRFLTYMISPILCSLSEEWETTVRPEVEQVSVDVVSSSNSKNAQDEINTPAYDEWQMALVKSHCEMIQTHKNLLTPDFCELTGCSSESVFIAIKKGIKYFQSRFGHGSSFQKVASSKRPYKYEFTLSGRVHPARLQIPGIQLLTETAFADEQECSQVEILQLTEEGHQAIRERFPGWDFLELEHPYKKKLVRLFMPII